MAEKKEDINNAQGARSDYKAPHRNNPEGAGRRRAGKTPKRSDAAKQAAPQPKKAKQVPSQKTAAQKSAAPQKKSEKAPSSAGKTRRKRSGSDAAKTAAVKAAPAKAPAAQQKTAPQKVAAAPKASRQRGRKAQAAGSGKLRIIPLGGLNEIGKNMTVLEYGDDIVVLDCGMDFPSEEMLGIDTVIPDFTYLADHSEKLRGVIITHGHEDHIGAVPYLLKQFSVPIYGTALTLGFIKHKLDEHKIKGDLRTIVPGDRLSLGCFDIEAVHTTHSVADSLAYSIDTPVGRIFHTGDFEVDYTPVDGGPIDLARLAAIGSEGVLLLMADSTNAARKGYTPSEKNVGISLGNIFRSISGRIIIATFSSNVHRVQKIVDIAVGTGRKVAISGRSMENMVDIASDLGYLNIPANTLVDLKKIKNVNDSELVVITTGSQGEPMSALARMASGEHRDVKIRPGDTVVLSSSPVPGNEKSVSNVVNALISLGARVIYNDIAETHVSGHACEEELKLIHTLIRPKFFMPVHGEVKHLMAHQEIAKSLGMDEKKIVRAVNGSVIELSENKVSVLKETVPAGDVLVDGYGIGDVGSAVLNERKYLSEAGLVIIAASFDRVSGDILSGPEIITRGFVYVKDQGKLLEDAKILVEETLMFALDEGKHDRNALRDLLRSKLRSFIFENTGRSPIILPVLMDC